MKIALVTKRVSYSKGGAEMVSANLLKEVAGKGHEIHVYTQEADTDTEGAMVHRIRTVPWISPLRLLSFRRKAARRIRDDGFDIVYALCHVYPVDIYRAGDGIHRHWMKVRYPNAAIRGMKYLTSLVHLAMRCLEGRLFQEGNCSLFITNSRLVREQIMEYFPVPSDRIAVIYNGVDHGLFHPDVKASREATRRELRIGQDEIVLLFIANNWERKGLSTIIEAMAASGNAQVILLVVGRGKKAPYLSLAGRNGIDPRRLVFAGHAKDTRRYYGAADFFALPSMYEPFANVCLEAMACGMPVITTKSNGSSEIVTVGHDGFLLDDWRDKASLTEFIGRLCDGSARLAMGENAARTAKRYTWQRHAEETEKVFRMVLDRKRQRQPFGDP